MHLPVDASQRPVIVQHHGGVVEQAGGTALEQRPHDDDAEFFGQSPSLKRENVHLMRRADGRASGDAYAVFETEEAAVAALSFDKQKLGTPAG